MARNRCCEEDALPSSRASHITSHQPLFPMDLCVSYELYGGMFAKAPSQIHGAGSSSASIW